MYKLCIAHLKPHRLLRKWGKYKLGILGISECRWTDSGRMCTKSETGESYAIIYSGQQDTHHRGVALIMNKQSVVQPRNIYNHTYIKFLSGQNKTISH